MAILQVHQAKALKQVHEGSTDPGSMQELRTATDFALRVTKVTAQSLRKAMSTMVVQERHLWLNLAEMKDADKACFLDAPSPRQGCSATPSRVSPKSSRWYSSRPRRSCTSCPGVMHHPPLPPGPGLSLPVAVGPLLRPPELLRPRLNQHIGRRVEPLAGERRPPRPSQAPSRPGSRRSGPDVGNPEMLEFALSQETARTAPLLPPVVGREENLLFHFVSVPPLVQGPAVPTFSKKEQFPFPPGSQVHGTTVCDALPPHSRPWRILPVAKRVRFGDDIPPHAPLASPVWDPGSSVRMPQNAPPSVPSTPTPFRCTTTGTSIVPLEPLAQRLEAWLTLPSLSRWLTRTIRLGYAIQFTRRPPKFNSVLEMSVAVRNAPVLRKEIAVLLAKDAIEPVPPAEIRQGFYSPYFIVPKKGGGLQPILDLRVLNRALHKLPFKMLTHRRMITCIQPQDWFAAIDLKDAYFHVSILPRHRPFILAQSREQLSDHRDLVLRHLSQLGLRVNWEKSKLSPVQIISFLGVELDSVSMTARLTEECAQAVLNCLSYFRGRNVVPLKQFQRFLGHMASAAAVTPFGHSSLTHIDSKNGNYVRLLFIDYSSAFNTIVPTKLTVKLSDLGLNTSLCDWIQDFLTARPQVVKVGQFTSNSITLNIGAPQGCVLSPLLYSLYTHDCVSSHSSTSIVKFADDTVVLGLVSNNDEAAYLDEVERLTSWCQDNCLSLNVSKTKELIVDFRKRQQRPYTPLMINGTPVERVSSFKYLGVNISEDLTWTTHIQTQVKKARQRLYHLRQLRKFRVSPAILKTFYSGAIESVLTQCISVWYGNSSNQDCKALQRVVRLAERISGSTLPSLQGIYIKRCKSRAAKIIKDSNHPGNHLFCLLPSGRRFRSMMAKTERLRKSFFPQAIRLLNTNSVS